MAAAVVADQAEMLRERLDLLVPHMQIGAEGVRQHQHRRALRPFDLDMDVATVIDFDVGHCYFLPGARTLVAPPARAAPISGGGRASVGGAAARSKRHG